MMTIYRSMATLALAISMPALAWAQPGAPPVTADPQTTPAWA